MKYLIKEDRLINLVDTYIEESVGELTKIPYDNINAREDDFELIDSNENIIFRYYDYELGMHADLFVKLLSLFNLNAKELTKIIEEWFKLHFPENLVLTLYPIIE